MNNSSEDYFPWLNKFTPLLNALIGNTNYDPLDQLLTIYEKNVSRDYSICLQRTFEAILLKDHIKNTLNFFHFCWRNVKERVSDDYPYLNKMSNILQVYLDLEVQFHQETEEILSANILTALCLYLDNSEEHIFKILLKGRYESDIIKKIYCPIFDKLLTNIKSSAESIKDFTYARYLLTFKLWSRIVDSRDEKLKITNMALQKLGSLIPQMDSKLSQIIPKPPNGCMNGTCWLMKYGLNELQKICDDFSELEAEMHSFLFYEKLKDSQLDIKNSPQENTLQKMAKRPLSKLKKNEVLLIDLIDTEVTIEEVKKETRTEEVKKIITKKQKTVKKPQWLKEIKIRHKFKKPQSILKRTKSVEVADAHSTEKCDNVEKTCANMCQKCDVTLNSSNDTNSNLMNTNTTSFNDNYYDKSSDLVTTCVNSVCDNYKSNILNLELRNTVDHVSEGISSRSDELLSNPDNESDKDDFSDVRSSITFEDDSECFSGVGTDYDSVDSELPETLTSPPWEHFVDSHKTLYEEIYDEPSLGEPSTLICEPPTFEKSLLSKRTFIPLFTNLDSLPSELFQVIDPNILRKKPGDEDVNLESLENEVDITEDSEGLFEEQVNMDGQIQKSGEVNVDVGSLKNEVDITEDLEPLFQDQVNVNMQMQNEVSSTSPPIHYMKSFVRRNLKEASKSSLSFELEDAFQENLVRGCLPFKKRHLSRRIREKCFSLLNKADI